MYYYFYHVFMSLSLVISIIVIFLLWRRRHLPAAPAMIALMASIFVWTLGYLLETHGTTLERQTLFDNIGYLGSMAVPPAWFVFASNYTNSFKFMRGWRLILITIIPIIITVLIWTNGWHHLMWSNLHLSTSGDFTVTVKTYGPFFWVALAHNYILILTGGIILLRRLFVGPRLYAQQAYAIILGVCLPWVWNIIYIFDLVDMPRKDLTPAMFAISGGVMVLALLRYRLFITVPFAREFIVRQLRDAVFIFDIRDFLVEANTMALKLAGTDKQIIGKKLEELLSVSPLFTHLTAGADHEEFTLSMAGQNHVFEIEITFMYISREEPAGRLVMLHDITERKKMEGQLIIQDRLASIGQLTSGVAHELNNPLTGIINYSSILLKRDLPEDIRPDIEAINEEAQRTAFIVKNLLLFSRQQRGGKEPVNITEGIQKVLALRAYEQKVKNISVNVRAEPDLPPVLGNTALLQQVFFNIIVNAEYFMLEAHQEGTLDITAKKTGASIRVTFTDDGPGIPEENMNQIFTPLFSTKEPGKGTGLGLSICLGIITEHGGRIWAENNPVQGASFIIELPVYVKPPEEED